MKARLDKEMVVKAAVEGLMNHSKVAWELELLLRALPLQAHLRWTRMGKKMIVPLRKLRETTK